MQGQKCGVCAKVCQAKAIDYEMKDSDVELNVAAVIVSTGYELFDATQIPEYGYGKLPERHIFVGNGTIAQRWWPDTRPSDSALGHSCGDPG